MQEASGLRFYYCGYEKCSGGHSFGPAVRAHYLIHFIISGKGIYQAAHICKSVEKNQAFLIRPKEITFYEADKTEPWEYIWFAFDGTEAEGLVNSFFSTDRAAVANAADCSRMEQLLHTALPSFQKRSLSQMELHGWCCLLFSVLQKQSEKTMYNAANTYFSKAIDYIRYHYMQDINVDQISSQLGIDRTYLYKIIKEYTGYSPKTYITRLRIEAAKNMLQYSEYSMTDIAAFCGFHDHSSFCKTFRRYERQTPSQYQQQFSP